MASINAACKRTLQSLSVSVSPTAFLSEGIPQKWHHESFFSNLKSYCKYRRGSTIQLRPFKLMDCKRLRSNFKVRLLNGN